MKTKDHYKNIADQEKKSDESWRKDFPTSPEERTENMYARVLNKVKTDEEG